MSEKSQGNANSLREKMLNRYGVEHKHKHNKNHLCYSKSSKSHPSDSMIETIQSDTDKGSTGLIRKFKLRKMRKRLDKGEIH